MANDFIVNKISPLEKTSHFTTNIDANQETKSQHKTEFINKDTSDFSYYKKKTNFKNIIIPSSMKIIKPLAYANCHELESIIVPNNIVRICTNAFINCSSLNMAFIPPTCYIEKDAFKNCNNLRLIYQGTFNQLKNNCDKDVFSQITNGMLPVLYADKIAKAITELRKNNSEGFEQETAHMSKYEKDFLNKYLEQKSLHTNNLDEKITCLIHQESLENKSAEKENNSLDISL